MNKVKLSNKRKAIAITRKNRHKLEDEILDYLSRKTLLRGSLYEAYKSCRKKGCKCMRGQKHGPFLYLSDKISGRSTMVFIRKSIEFKARELGNNYVRWRRIRAQIAKYNNEILHLMDEMEQMNTIKVSDIAHNGDNNKSKKRHKR